jgi:hypothetical protein
MAVFSGLVSSTCQLLLGALCRCGKQSIWSLLMLGTNKRTRKDFAQCIRELVDVHYVDAEKIVLILDNLNTHSADSFYEAFEPG